MQCIVVCILIESNNRNSRQAEIYTTSVTNTSSYATEDFITGPYILTESMHHHSMQYHYVASLLSVWWTYGEGGVDIGVVGFV